MHEQDEVPGSLADVCWVGVREHIGKVVTFITDGDTTPHHHFTINPKTP